MQTATLTSLAMLKLNIDQGGDYLDYLRPFILQVLVDHTPDPVTANVVSQHLLTEFGLQVPQRAAQVVLKRLSRKYPLTRKAGVYRITGALPDPAIATWKAEAHRHIRAVITGLIDFSKGTAKPLSNRQEAVQALCSFLGEFDISCLTRISHQGIGCQAAFLV